MRQKGGRCDTRRIAVVSAWKSERNVRVRGRHRGSTDEVALGQLFEIFEELLAVGFEDAAYRRLGFSRGRVGFFAKDLREERQSFVDARRRNRKHVGVAKSAREPCDGIVEESPARCSIERIRLFP